MTGKTGTISDIDFSEPFPFGVRLDTGVLRRFSATELQTAEFLPDPVNEPGHYKLPNGVEVIDITETLNFNRGNAIKYLYRAGRKKSAPEIQDLEKALWYVTREIQRLKEEAKSV
ncbi:MULTISPECIES: DUF3310 domain-containing protein [Streptomyces]|uniref:DUF3310 domain-containing protein n=1 Tax=Streptomyces TaxID=1883 RepID=UPI0033E325DF